VTGQAGATLAARSDRADEYAIADPVPSYAGTQLFDYADRLVPDNQTFPDGILAAHYVQICSADSRKRHANNCLTRTRARPLNFFNSNLVFAVKDRCSHAFHRVFASSHVPSQNGHDPCQQESAVSEIEKELQCGVLGFDCGILLIETGPAKRNRNV
jgi:hypothetical protein